MIMGIDKSRKHRLSPKIDNPGALSGEFFNLICRSQPIKPTELHCSGLDVPGQILHGNEVSVLENCLHRASPD
jgi:hypothetical protein